MPAVLTLRKTKDVTLNVSGRVFIIKRSKLAQYPDHFLGSAKLETFYDKERDEYFLERNSDVFTPFYEFYNSGYFKIPRGPPMAAILDEIEFLQVGYTLVPRNTAAHFLVANKVF